MKPSQKLAEGKAEVSHQENRNGLLKILRKRNREGTKEGRSRHKIQCLLQKALAEDYLFLSSVCVC